MSLAFASHPLFPMVYASVAQTHAQGGVPATSDWLRRVFMSRPSGEHGDLFPLALRAAVLALSLPMPIVPAKVSELVLFMQNGWASDLDPPALARFREALASVATDYCDESLQGVMTFIGLVAGAFGVEAQYAVQSPFGGTYTAPSHITTH